MLLALIFGMAFGAILQFAGVNRFDTIAGMSTLEDFTIAKVMASGIAIGAVLISLEVTAGTAGFHVKPVLLGGIVWGGLMFGVGMAVLGYCPGTLAISLGEGSIDALLGIIGGLVGGLVFAGLWPSLQELIGPDTGAVSLSTQIGDRPWLYYLLVLVLSGLILLAVWRVDRRENAGKSDKKWLWAGVGLALLNGVMILDATSGRPIGASTAFPWVAAQLTGLGELGYIRRITSPGSWEAVFLLGAFLAALAGSLLRGTFRPTLIYDHWRRYKGNGPTRRILWSLFGGFLIVFGARMAGGCTSGHILSGGMQLAKSGLIFAAFVFTSFLLTGKLFYSGERSGAVGSAEIGPIA